jgi:hypothetical protein
VPEGVATADGQVAPGVHDDPDSPPPPNAEAPKGWAWQRKSRSGAPRQRGPVLWQSGSAEGWLYTANNTKATPGAEVPAPDSSGHGDAAPGTEQQDPDPGWMRQDAAADSKKFSGSKLKFDDVPQAVKDDIAGLAGLVGTPILAVLKSIDPYCGTVLAENFEPVVDATLPLMCRSEKIVAYFTGDKADWLLWGKLAMALAPVGRAIAEHHIFKTVEVVKDEKTGVVTILRGGQDHGHGDHLQPAVPAEQYAA